MSIFLFRFLNLYKFVQVFCALILLFTAQICSAQENLHNQTGCTYLAKDKPSVFISYNGETTVKNERGQIVRKILLRLHNNSSCEINVETTDTSFDKTLNRKEVTPQRDGLTIITRYIPNPPKDFELPIFYDIKKSEGKTWKPANYFDGRDLVFTYPIPSGYSATFPVDEFFFRKRLPISVPFEYSWEGNSELRTLGTISHRVVYSYELPTGFYKD